MQVRITDIDGNLRPPGASDEYRPVGVMEQEFSTLYHPETGKTIENVTAAAAEALVAAGYVVTGSYGVNSNGTVSAQCDPAYVEAARAETEAYSLASADERERMRQTMAAKSVGAIAPSPAGPGLDTTTPREYAEQQERALKSPIGQRTDYERPKRYAFQSAGEVAVETDSSGGVVAVEP